MIARAGSGSPGPWLGLTAALALAASGRAVARTTPDRPSAPRADRPAPRPVAVKVRPLTRAALQRALRRLSAGPVLTDGTFSIHVEEAGGPVIFSRRGRTALHPASCVKLVTAAAVLRALGAKHRFATLLRGRIVDQRLTGPLYLVGRGDPSLSRDHVRGFAALLKKRGVTTVAGGIVVDDSHFDGRRWPPGFNRRTGSAYAAPTGAVSMDGNTCEVRATPTRRGQRARVELLPPSAYLSGRFRVFTGRRTTFWAWAGPDRHGVRVIARGRIKAGSGPRSRFARILHPARYAGETLKRFLEDAGLKVGPVRRGRVPRALPPLLHRHLSEPLPGLLKFMMEHSNNFYAEQLLKVLGARVFGAPGSTRKGIRAAGRTLKWAGIARQRYRLANGSGLGGVTRVSTRLLCTLLQRIYRAAKIYPVIRDSLAIAGQTGTLKKRMRGTVAQGRVRAKTGTIKQVSALAGYVYGKPGSRPLVFAMLHNGFEKSLIKVRDRQYRIVELLTRYALSR